MNDALIHNLKTDPRRFLPIFLSIAVILTVLGLTFFVLVPEVYETYYRISDIEANKKKDKSLSEKAHFLTTVSARDLQRDYQILETLVPSQADITAVTQTIEGIALQNNAVLGSIRLEPASLASVSGTAVTNDKPTTLSLQLIYSGQQQTMIKILDDFYATSPLFSIESAKITNTSSGLSRMQVDVITHFVTPPQTLGSPDKPLKQFTEAQKLIIKGISSYHKYDALTIPIDTIATGSSVQRKTLFSQ